MTIDQIANLTDRQISQLYFHPRTKDGSIKPKDEPIPEGTYKADLLALDILHQFYHFHEQTLRDQLGAIRTKYSIDDDQFEPQIARLLRMTKKVITGERIAPPMRMTKKVITGERIAPPKL